MKLFKKKERCAGCSIKVDVKAPSIFITGNDGTVEIKICDACAENLETNIMKVRSKNEEDRKER